MSLQPLDILWITISLILVALMQPGFTALEAGSTRAKNSTSTAIKNLSDFIISMFVFLTVGASLMLGGSYNGLFGVDSLFFYSDNFEQIALVIFHAMFAATAVTIISGAIAERTKFTTYLLIAVWVSLFIYPVQAHWTWNEDGWLAQLGFIDFAGSTVVHSVGGWAALAAIIVIGPRLGRFEQKAPFEKSNLSYSTLGVFLIWIGWIGFNGGSLLTFNQQTAVIILNTLIAGATGGISGLIASRIRNNVYQVEDIMHGTLAGLVSITALANLVEPYHAIWIGTVGYIAYSIGEKVLIKFKIDDAIEAIPVHLFAGAAGTLLTAFFVPDTAWQDQMIIQLIGILSVGAFTFSLTYLFLSLVNRYYKLRVSESNEVIGLNVSEHQATTSVHDLIMMMQKHADTKDFSTRIIVEPFSDAFLVAEFYNDVTKTFNQLNDENLRLIEESSYMANYDHLTGLAKRRVLITELEQTIQRLDREQQTHCLLFLDLDGFKSANDNFGHDAGDQILKIVAKRLKSVIRKGDTLSRFGGDEFVILLANIEDETAASIIADKIIAEIKEPILSLKSENMFINCSIGLKTFDQNSQLDIDYLIKEADSAMYTAKKNGKGRWIIA